MPKIDYKIFGLPEGADKAEIDAAYASLKAQYSEDRFKEGEEGNIASRKLMELENAYEEINSSAEYRQPEESDSPEAENAYAGASFNNGGQDTDFSEDYRAIDALIKENRLEEAQRYLDDMSFREAEWHYFQALVFYKRNWYGECRTQLHMAVKMQPLNPKYRTAAEKLELFLGNIRVENNMGPQNNGYFNQDPNNPQNNSACNNPMNCCYPMCCCPFCC